MISDLFTSTFFISTGSHCVPLFIFIWRWQHHPKEYKLVFGLLLASFASDVAIWLLSRNGQPSIVVTNFYTIVEFVLLNLFYYKIVFQKQQKIYFLFTSTLFVLSLLISVISQGLLILNSYLWAISSIILSVHAILYFYLLPLMIVERYLDKHLFSNVIMNAFLSFYFFTSIVIFVLMDFVFTNLTADEARGFWSIYNIINILKNFGIALAFFLSGKRKPYISFTHFENLGKNK